jgi:molecular chaperone GrpE
MSEMNDENVELEGEPTPASSDVEAMKAERDQLYQKLARVQADFTNSRKRLEQDFDQRLVYANETLIKALLPVIDNFERALLSDPATTDSASIQKGLQVVHDQLMDVLKNFKVETIAPEVGTPFDPAMHQALMQQPSDQYTEPTVTQLYQKGYLFNGRSLRPASVVVSKTAE